MKKIIGSGLKVLWVLSGLLLFTSCLMYMPPEGGPGPAPEPEGQYAQTSAPSQNMDVSYFYDYLSDYGQWTDYPGYGYVWVPYDMGLDWHPYSYGRWVWTEYGWTWISSYRWGWIPFHYGRWAWEPGFGWFWVPDTVWGPAWVSWRWGGSWIGWAPLPPRYRYGFGRGLYLSSIDMPDDCWLFVDSRHFDADDVRGYVLPRMRNRELVRSTVFKAQLEEQGDRIVNNGLSLDEARRLSHAPFATYHLESATTPQSTKVSSGRVMIYKPEVKARATAVPRKVVSKDEVKKTRGQGEKRVIKRDEPAPSLSARILSPGVEGNARPVSSFSSSTMVSSRASSAWPEAGTPVVDRALVSTAKSFQPKQALTVPGTAFSSSPAFRLPVEKNAPLVTSQALKVRSVDSSPVPERTIVKKDAKVQASTTQVTRTDAGRVSADSRRPTLKRTSR